MNGNNLTKEALRKAKEAERINYQRTLGSQDQRRNQADVKKYKQNTP